MYQKIRKEVKAMSCEEGGFNPGKLWQLKKKLSPKHTASPTAMRDSNEKILTTDEEVKAEAIKHYKNVFKDKPIDKELTNVQRERELLSEERLKSAYKNKTPMWTVEDVQNAIKDLNVGVSKDPYGWPNELFKKGIAGKDLLRGVTILMNKIKENPQDYPTSMDLCNVTSIYKNKGDISSFDSHRGVFRTTILRNILDRLMYNDEYSTVDENMTDCNVGSRKKEKHP